MDNESNMTQADFANPKGIEAYDGYVILAVAKPKKQSAAGLTLPGKGIEGEPGVGKVVSIGHGVERLKIGQIVQWKDTLTYTANSQKVTADSAVYVDMQIEGHFLVAVRKDMIMLTRKV